MRGRETIDALSKLFQCLINFNVTAYPLFIYIAGPLLSLTTKRSMQFSISYNNSPKKQLLTLIYI